MAKQQSKDDSAVVTAQQVDDFERVVKELDALHAEFVGQAKSKPDNAINKFKLKMLNEKVVAANRLLTGAFKPFEGFTEFDEDDLPTNSDVSLILTTYRASLERWRSAHVWYDEVKYKWIWRMQAGERIDTSAPTRYKPEDK